MKIIRPPKLTTGDKVGLIAPAKRVTNQEVEPGIKEMESWGLKVVQGHNLLADHHFLAGNDEQRKNDFQKMIDDPEIRAIFCIRGGYGSTRIVDQLDFSQMIEHPKWLIGYSDITIFLNSLYNLNLESIHGLMPFQFGKTDAGASINSLKKLLWQEEYLIDLPSHYLNKTGQAAGRLVGGNLSMLCNALGTESDIDTRDTILFIEDIDEYLYKLDRMMVQLKRAGKLSHLKGLLAGYFTEMPDTSLSFGMNAYEIIQEKVQEFDYPVCFGFPIGHELPNLALPVGRMAQLSVSQEQVKLTFE
ncbi:MAG: S66 peptidase family protein [Candidatus Cyclobacteriaceae bacterium M3_2C_046]